MKKDLFHVTVFLLCILGCGFTFSMTAQTTDINRAIQLSNNYDEWAEFLHKQMTDYVENENIPNAVIALVTRDDIHLLEGYGYADMEHNIPVHPERHLFRVGSVAKLFTWAAVMQLYEQGMVDLDKDINTYLDIDLNFKIKYKTEEPEPITLNHLLSHTAGFENILENLFLFAPLPPLHDYLLQRLPARIFPPGEVIAYSNYGSTLAGYIVEQISGMSFEEYVEIHIFEPLGMQNSSFRQPLPDELEAWMVNAYRWVDGEFLPGKFEHMPSPAGGISTSALDMALFMKANLNQGLNSFGSFMQPETLSKMHSTLFKYHPLTGGMAHGFMEFTINGQRVLLHGGSSSIFDAGLYLFPDIETGLLIAYSGGDYLGHNKILHDFLDEFFPVEDEAESTDIPALFEPELREIKGEFHSSLRSVSGEYKMLNLVFGSMHVRKKSDNDLGVWVFGQYYVFREIAPGIYKNTEPTHTYPFGPMNYIVAAKAPDGKLMLTSDGPVTFIKVSWYEGLRFVGFILIPALILAIGSLLFFFGRFVYRKVRKPDIPQVNTRTTQYRYVIVHAATFLLFVILMVINSAPDPVHSYPPSFFGERSVIDIVLDILPFVIAILGIVILVIAVNGWRKKQWNIPVRIYYSIYAVWSVGIIWFFYYYNWFGL
jgi:CubicO group peptidase (beta-lactamase class C family)